VSCAHERCCARHVLSFVPAAYAEPGWKPQERVPCSAGPSEPAVRCSEQLWWPCSAPRLHGHVEVCTRQEQAQASSEHPMAVEASLRTAFRYSCVCSLLTMSSKEQLQVESKDLRSTRCALTTRKMMLRAPLMSMSWTSRRATPA
jgi:hypothetical protein